MQTPQCPRIHRSIVVSRLVAWCAMSGDREFAASLRGIHRLGPVVIAVLVIAGGCSTGDSDRIVAASSSTEVRPAPTTSMTTTTMSVPTTAPPVTTTTIAKQIPPPPAAFLERGVPKPGSAFENLDADATLKPPGKFVALTFDDGPSQYTDDIVDILNFFQVKATFFMIAPQIIEDFALVKEMKADGMRIGAHTRTHKHLRELPLAAKTDEVAGSIDDINNALGPGTVRCFRPPYREFDQQVVDLVAKKKAAMALWSIDTDDWEKPSWTTLVSRVLGGVRDRSVILMHDGGGNRTETILALPWILQGLKDQGFSVVPVC